MRDFGPILHVITSVDWLARVGVVDDGWPNPRVTCVGTWQEALHLRGSIPASNAFLEGANRLTRELSSQWRSEYRKWNSLVANAHEALNSDIMPRVADIIDSNDAVSKVENGVAFLKHILLWDLVCTLMEYAYSELVPIGFYGQVLSIYKDGHFPCHWDQVWPGGKVWVY